MSTALHNGIRMPLVGLGTFKIRGSEMVCRTIEAALSAGYRSIDTAGGYRNEKDIGESLLHLLPKYGLQRSDVFITSKLAPVDQGSGKCRQACLNSISNLQTAFLDLFLIHWPGTQGLKQEDPKNRELRLQSWTDMEQLYNEGKLKAIGVSNYEQRHLEELLQQCSVRPAVLQIEQHPHLNQKSLVEFCKKEKIHFQAYSSLGTTTDDNQLLSDLVVKRVSESCGKSCSQVLLKWAVQQGIGVLPKSVNPQHIKENIDIFSFELKPSEMEELNSLDKQHHYCWNPVAVL